MTPLEPKFSEGDLDKVRRCGKPVPAQRQKQRGILCDQYDFASLISISIDVNRELLALDFTAAVGCVDIFGMNNLEARLGCESCELFRRAPGAASRKGTKRRLARATSPCLMGALPSVRLELPGVAVLELTGSALPAAVLKDELTDVMSVQGPVLRITRRCGLNLSASVTLAPQILEMIKPRRTVLSLMRPLAERATAPNGGPSGAGAPAANRLRKTRQLGLFELAPKPATPAAPAAPPEAAAWACTACTYMHHSPVNVHYLVCEVCKSPRGS